MGLCFIWLRGLLSFQPRAILSERDRHGQFIVEFVLPWWHRCEFAAQDVGWLMPTQTRRRCALVCGLQKAPRAYYKERTLVLFSASAESSPAVSFHLSKTSSQKNSKKIMVTSQKYISDCTKWICYSNTYLKAEQTSEYGRKAIWSNIFWKGQKKPILQWPFLVLIWSGSGLFQHQLLQGVTPKSHLLWLQVNTSHLSTTCSRSLVVLDVELNLKWWHLAYISCPFHSYPSRKKGSLKEYTTYITKVQTRLTCCCTLEKFSVFLCITGPYGLALTPKICKKC